MAKRLTPKMVSALKLMFQAEIGISRTDQSVARSGIIEGYMIKTNTSCALIDRGLHTPLHTVHGERFSQVVHQITAAGCEAIGRSMDEIVAWAREWAYVEYFERTTLTAGNMMVELPVEVGAVVGWTHEGQSLTGEVRSIFGDALSIWVPSSTTTGYEWTVELGQIERVIELAPKCDHGVRVASETPSAFEGAAPVRDYADGCQSFGSYPERAPMRSAQIGAAQINAYAHDLGIYSGASGMRSTGTVYPTMGGEPVSTPREPVGRFGPIDKAAILSKPIDSLLNSGVVEQPQPEEPKGLMALVNDAIAAAIQSERVNTLGSAYFGSVGERSNARTAATAALEAIQQRLNLAAALMPAEVRQILDGHTPAPQEPTCAKCGGTVVTVTRNGRTNRMHADYMETAHDHAAMPA